MSRAGLPCVTFREAYYIPTFSKWQVHPPRPPPPPPHPPYSFVCDPLFQGNITAGVSVSINDASCLDSLPLGIAGHI
jgi:hypothetical protein